jgi:hypothetical protein
MRAAAAGRPPPPVLAERTVDGGPGEEESSGSTVAEDNGPRRLFFEARGSAEGLPEALASAPSRAGVAGAVRPEVLVDITRLYQSERVTPILRGTDKGCYVKAPAQPGAGLGRQDQQGSFRFL